MLPVFLLCQCYRRGLTWAARHIINTYHLSPTIYHLLSLECLVDLGGGSFHLLVGELDVLVEVDISL